MDPSEACTLYGLEEVERCTIGASDGDIGSVADVYFDDASWTVRYLVVDTGTWLPGRKVLVSPASVEGVDMAASRVRTNLTRQQVRDAPPVDAAKPVSRQYESEISAYYGYPFYWTGPYRWGAGLYPTVGVGGAPYPPPPPSPYPGAVGEELAARERAGHDPHLRSAKTVRGYGIEATDGALGHVEDFLIDDETWAIRYLIVDPANWWPGRHVLVSPDWITGVSWNDSVVAVDAGREAVRNAPPYDKGRRPDRDYESRLHEAYRRPGYWDRHPGS
jgi:hypothetical protein